MRYEFEMAVQRSATLWEFLKKSFIEFTIPVSIANLYKEASSLSSAIMGIENDPKRQERLLPRATEAHVQAYQKLYGLLPDFFRSSQEHFAYQLALLHVCAELSKQQDNVLQKINALRLLAEKNSVSVKEFNQTCSAIDEAVRRLALLNKVMRLEHDLEDGLRAGSYLDADLKMRAEYHLEKAKQLHGYVEKGVAEDYAAQEYERLNSLVTAQIFGEQATRNMHQRIARNAKNSVQRPAAPAQ